MALSAFILIEVAGDHTKSAYKTVQRISGVKAAYTVSGNYDLIVQVDAENMEELSDMLMSKIEMKKQKKQKSKILLNKLLWRNLEHHLS